MLDLKIVGGTLVDGTGAPRRIADIGIKDGRIVMIDKCEEDARQTIDATGLVVAPGFVDIHTHYDAQAFWDPTFSPSCFHGVTTVLGGFCGFSIAPLSGEAAPYLRAMLARVEGMPLRTLEIAVPWDWESFGDFLDRLEGRVGLNAGFFCGHSAIRRVVMGERAVGETATDEDLAAMKALLDRSLSEGALGFSTTVSPTHSDGDGRPVPSRWASRQELLELAAMVRPHVGTGLELLPNLSFDADTLDLLTEFSLAGQRPVNWNVLAVTAKDDKAQARISRQLAASDYARARGAEVVALVAPNAPNVFLNFFNGVLFDTISPEWSRVMNLPLDQRMSAMRDADLRRRLAADAAAVDEESPNVRLSRLPEYKVVDVKAEVNEPFQGRTIADIATDSGQEPIDVMFDIALADRLLTTFAPLIGIDDEEVIALRGEVWRDARTIVGASDAGAHMDMIDTFAFTTIVLGNGVRESGVISLEEAVHQLSKRPAEFMGLVDRGEIALGYHADVVVFDPDRIARGALYSRHDVPGDGVRLYADAIGVEHVLVGGTAVVRDGAHTGALPGTILRSGRDTRTNPLPGTEARQRAI